MQKISSSGQMTHYFSPTAGEANHISKNASEA